MTKKTVAFTTLGCKLNFSETSTIARKFEEKGYVRLDFEEKADVFVINTCTVTENANKKCRQTISKAIRNNPNSFIAVVGCYSQLQAKEIAQIEGVDLVLGTHDKFKILDFIEGADKNNETEIHSCNINQEKSFESSYSSNDRTRTFLKIQDGCDYFCSYCTIPFARGRSRNNSISAIVKEAEEIAKSGVQEIVLTGINIGDFGKSTNESFYQLLMALEQIPALNRIRLSSIEPNLITEEIIQLVAQSNKYQPHFHIPLQSGCDIILKQMNRKYQRDLFTQKVSLIKKYMPLAAIGADVIVGFPGETEADFEDTYQFIERVDLSFLHVFSYSERKKTRAAGFENKVSKQQKDIRSKKLHILANDKKEKFYYANIGQTHQVLFEAAENKGKISGFTGNYIRVETDFEEQLIKSIKECTIKNLLPNGNMSVSF